LGAALYETQIAAFWRARGVDRMKLLTPQTLEFLTSSRLDKQINASDLYRSGNLAAIDAWGRRRCNNPPSAGSAIAGGVHVVELYHRYYKKADIVTMVRECMKQDALHVFEYHINRWLQECTTTTLCTTISAIVRHRDMRFIGIIMKRNDQYSAEMLTRIALSEHPVLLETVLAEFDIRDIGDGALTGAIAGNHRSTAQLLINAGAKIHWLWPMLPGQN
jgi:hypothetical protein